MRNYRKLNKLAIKKSHETEKARLQDNPELEAEYKKKRAEYMKRYREARKNSGKGNK